ncbi:F-box protein At5g18160-like [Cornus florida]|uniref:F-box protein At5g18160-like n=1 Tax=Cornus florida TaxID=4283 RepID=UPI00289F7CA6|nr:F-box protein At5g18160-like [Cornus florida]
MASSPTRRASSPPEETTETAGPTHLCPTLPSDLIFNIVSRLPVKVLGKFESVSKQWRFMITDPYFILTHRNRSLQNPNLLLLRKVPNDDDSDNPQKKKTTVEVCGLDSDGKLNIGFTLDVNDAIDMLPSKWDLICFAGENGFYVCNPSTQEFVKLPEASCCTSGEINAGMGYISSRNEYVLIHLYDRSLDIYVDNDIGCEVIRLSDGCVRNCSWKVVEANCPHVVRGWGVLVENVFYWMIWEEYDHPGNEAIVSFDLEKEEFGTISPPEGCLDPNGVWSLVELRGSLCLVDSATQPSTMDIWVLKDLENHKWVKEFRIDWNGFSEELLKFITPLDYQNGEILMDAKQESLHYYNVENKCFKRMDNLVAGGWTWLRLYTESFFSLGSR